MEAKHAEEALREMLNAYGWDHRKYGDVRYPNCPRCHTVFTTCPICKEKWVLPKSENAPDMSAGEYNWFECKNSNATGSWAWTEISETGKRSNQRKFLLERAGKSWLFIVLGTGRAPKGKGAYLIPFDEWVGVVEPQLTYMNMKSLVFEATQRRVCADHFLSSYRLSWLKGHWEIPDGHIWWLRRYAHLQAQLLEAERHLHDNTPRQLSLDQSH